MRAGKFLRKMIFLVILFFASRASASEIIIIYPPEWSADAARTKAIAEALSQGTGITIRPLIADTYTQLVEAFSQKKPVLGYLGSFAQAVLFSRGLYVPILQGVDGEEFYTSVMIVPESAAGDPFQIIRKAGSEVAYCVGTSSGESGAKAATQGKAALAFSTHEASVNAVITGEAQAAFVKDKWWESKKDEYKGLKCVHYPVISSYRHPARILCANKFVSDQDRSMIKKAALNSEAAFGVKSFNEVQSSIIEQTLALMRKAGINPSTYSWEK